MAGGRNGPAPTPSIPLLERIVTQARLQAAKDPRGHRYNDPFLLRFSMNSFLLGGRLFYEILQANLGKGVFPSVRCIETKLAEFDVSVPKGQINVKMLKEILTLHKLPMIVALSEDATAVTGRREYCKKTNSTIGSSGPLTVSCLPDSSAFVVNNAESIVSHMKNYERASVAMVVMAQPIAEKIPAIRLCAFGSNNKFTSDDVKNRLATIETALNQEGIEGLTYASDGDSRELKMMRQRIGLGIKVPKMKAKGKYIYIYMPFLCHLLIVL